MLDESAKVKRVERPKADRRNPAHIGASMPGNVVEVFVAEGEQVAKGQALAVTEAMRSSRRSKRRVRER